jgi:hypothetical protein
MVRRALLKHINPVKYLVHSMQLEDNNTNSKIIPKYKVKHYMNNPNTMLSKAHLTTLNVNNFKMVEAMGLKMTALRPS